MSHADFLIDKMAELGDRPALSFRGKTIPYGAVGTEIAAQRDTLERLGIGAGSVVVLQSDYRLESVAVLVALIDMGAIVVPVIPENLDRRPGMLDPVPVDAILTFDDQGALQCRRSDESTPEHDLIRTLRVRKMPGLILFTSGSSGAPKGVVHDFSKLLNKFRVARGAFRTINFLMFDHWGGLNTLLHSLSNGSFVVLPEKRTPAYILQMISDHGIELLPVSPSFLNMMLISGTIDSLPDLDLSSLKLITYGAEPMPETTLARARALFGEVDFRQTYGLIELGVLRAKSKDPDSLWVKIGGEGYDIRIKDEMLEIKSDSAMLGYLNAPSPFTDDGYFMTQDKVLVDGDYVRILGRESEQINTGGEKVYPQEVENVLLQHEAVRDATVYGKPHVLLGKILVARVQVAEGQDTAGLAHALKLHCRQTLEAYKVPVKFEFSSTTLISERQKKSRAALSAT